jgi:hypothetical protein
MMREIGVQLNPTTVARRIETHHRIAQGGRRPVVDAQIALAAKRRQRAPHVHFDTLTMQPVRSRKHSAAARPIAAIVAVASVPTRYTEGRPGSSPVSVTASSAAASQPAAVQR